MTSNGLVWIRRDIRLHDHPAIEASLRENDQTYLLFIYDPNIIDPLLERAPSDRRLQFISESLFEVAKTLEKQDAGLIVVKGDPVEEIPKLVVAHQISTVYVNRDYMPYARKRDKTVCDWAESNGVAVQSFKDHVVFEPDDVLKQDGTPYHVFTPYSRTWLQHLAQNPIENSLTSYKISQIKNDCKQRFNTVEDLLKIAEFEPCALEFPGGTTAAKQRLKRFEALLDGYKDDRDFPALDHTSGLSVYIRHGCVSIRDLVQLALSSKSDGAKTWLNELIWREFYQMILWHYPDVKTKPFNPKYNDLVYPGSEERLAKWKAGQTGFPIIDAAMRCLNQTGWMHNRLRMVVASFLSKILLVDWRRGERYFSWKLLDYDLAANSGGWQWAAGTGCDAAPYFRIFNPYTQSKKFDADGTFITAYCPELAHLSAKEIHEPPPVANYPRPIVDYKTQRQEALELYDQLKGAQS